MQSLPSSAKSTVCVNPCNMETGILYSNLTFTPLPTKKLSFNITPVTLFYTPHP